ncbi:MAG TPA: hypothetical protein VFX60_08425 [Micromonospora sp.]|nr:hypothetical protein [Micromonospora sp.]
MTRSWVVVAAGVAVLAVVLAGVMVARWSAAREDRPAQPTVNVTTDPGVTSTLLPSQDESYWTPERMRSAQPAPMPTD